MQDVYMAKNIKYLTIVSLNKLFTWSNCTLLKIQKKLYILGSVMCNMFQNDLKMLPRLI